MPERQGSACFAGRFSYLCHKRTVPCELSVFMPKSAHFGIFLHCQVTKFVILWDHAETHNPPYRRSSKAWPSWNALKKWETFERKNNRKRADHFLLFQSFMPLWLAVPFHLHIALIFFCSAQILHLPYEYKFSPSRIYLNAPWVLLPHWLARPPPGSPCRRCGGAGKVLNLHKYDGNWVYSQHL